MADTQTPNYGLYKIGSVDDTVGTHIPDHYNANQDSVDAALAENAANITSHTGNSNIHVTAAQKSTWNAKAPTASPTFTGTPTAPTAAAGTNTTQIATTAFVQTAVSGKANTASPALTGTPTAPTAAAGTDTTQIATTAFVQGELSNRPVGLTADLSLHVNATSGNDSNDGLTTGTALKTINAAVAKIPKDTAGRVVVINLAAVQDNDAYAAASIDSFNGITLIVQKEASASVESVIVQGATITNNAHSTIIWSSLTFNAEVTSNTHTRMATGIFSSCVFNGARLNVYGNNRISGCTFRNIPSSTAIVAEYGTVYISALKIENTVSRGVYAMYAGIVSVGTYNTTNNATIPYAAAYSGRVFVGGRTYKENAGVENIYNTSTPFSVTGDKSITLTEDMQNYSSIILYLTTSSTNASGNRCMVRFTPWELPAAPEYVVSTNGTDFYGVRLGLVTNGVYTQLRFISTTAPNLYIVQAVGVIR